MVLKRLYRRTGVRSGLVVALVGLGLVAATPNVGGAAAGPTEPQPITGVTDPALPGLGPVDPDAHYDVPGPLPVMAGTVDTKGDAGTSSISTTSRSTGIRLMAAESALAPSDQVGLRALVIAVDGTDFGLATWTSMLNRVGAAYDVLHAGTTPLTAETLIGADGVGKYNAILLTNSMLLNPDFTSALDGNEWNLLWSYERDFKVRQVALYSSHGTFPEDYCTRAKTEGSVGATAVNATLTTAGRTVFDDLKTTIAIPILESYVYRTTLQAGCAATPILQIGTDVLGVLSTTPDGRERAALTFTSNENLMQSYLLTYGLFRWASRGLYLGEQRHYFNVDVDDWFNSSDHLYTDGHIESEPGYQLSGHDAYMAYLQQLALRLKYPLANSFKFALAYNGGDANLNARSTCSIFGGVSTLTATSRCLRNEFYWINHTLTHPELNTSTQAATLTEINANLDVATRLGLPVDRTVLKTPEYSGLGVYNPNPDDDLSPPTDFGLAASNVAMLAAAKAAGVKYLHGNMSFASHKPTCFNCSIVHPLESSLQVVPDWPTNIAYHVGTPAEETYFYNSFYGPNGRFPYWTTNLTYAQLLDYEASIALGHVMTGSVYTHTLHISNLKDYNGLGKSLAVDWVDKVLAKYAAYYRVPVRTQAWPALAGYTTARNAHFAGLTGGVGAVYNRTTNVVTVTAPVAATVTVSGARTTGFNTYGTEVSAPISVGPTTTVTFTPTLRP
jgi:hypothetical protein